MKYFFTALALIFTLNAEPSLAAGLVPCDGLDCDMCQLVDLGNNVINWLIGVLMVVFAIIAAWAGFELVVSGGNTSAKESAKSKFTNAFIGLIIVLAAWLIVDTLMRTLLIGSNGVLSNGVYTGFGPWSQIQCEAQPTVSTAPTTPTATTTPGVTACPINDLSPITDPVAQSLETNPISWANTDPDLQACANKFISLVGGQINSVYRPQAYQTHLWELKNRWCDASGGLKNNTNASCSTLKTKVAAEVTKHFGSNWNCGAVAVANSTHTKGDGIDIGNINVAYGSAAMKDAASKSCLTWPNYSNDKWHFTLVAGCSCN